MSADLLPYLIEALRRFFAMPLQPLIRVIDRLGEALQRRRNLIELETELPNFIGKSVDAGVDARPTCCHVLAKTREFTFHHSDQFIRIHRHSSQPRLPRSVRMNNVRAKVPVAGARKLLGMEDFRGIVHDM
ncbi:MAG TPA: hypothetical protein VJZ00_06065 [Thermoanaerobaculia bacterium]|nr:hypothetical protein [Thermoanaerobaculia bacterium]